MSISAALSNALSSLAAEQRQAAILSNNIANASTPGYVRRDMPRSERLVAGTGSGVNTDVTQRLGDAALAAASRSADASEAYAQQLQEGLEAYNALIGQPSDARSLSSRLGAFQTAMTTLSSAPDNAVAQSQALEAARDLVDALHDADAAVAKARSEADLQVSRDVEGLNSAFDQLAEIDRKLALASARGGSTAEYEDRRDVLLAEIGKTIPIRIFDNGPGHLLVMSDGGNTLYDSTVVHRLDFTHSPVIQAEQRHPAALSAVTVDGQALRISDTGSLAGALRLRDDTLPKFVDMLDQVAVRLIESFQDADPTLTGNQAGLFTDAGAANWDGSGGYPTFVGMARKIELNAAVDPEQGGQLWRMRTGVNATAQGNAGDNTHIIAALDAMNASRAYDSSTGLPASMTLSQAASQSIGLMQGERAVWSDRAETRGRLAAEAREELSNKTAVNVDEELQRLLLVQQTYSASVQIIQAATRMLDELSTIGR
ncbi:flagellar hook-associated protein FlgK [Pseudoroseomonas cervicalis]|uniref:flagellar hook-associated protein FlgK n=1 Tax=Teichococcus cervicalis TaxID=204525 RepID=UPI002783BD86|nr:flagellar hook-associated protein FlgK [Pseudoroseomonas cervicalis]MDQ1077561.1 flagellar hook-associated protein 1 FlgK [Pseudoroseomonas cervicalis]